MENCQKCIHKDLSIDKEPCANCTAHNKYIPFDNPVITLKDLQENLKVSVICPTRNIVKVSVWYGDTLLTEDEDEL